MIDIVQRMDVLDFVKIDSLVGRKLEEWMEIEIQTQRSHISTKGENTKRRHNGKGVLGKSRFFIKESNTTD